MCNTRKVIRLVRHGPSAHAWPTQRITAEEFREWIRVMNETGIAADSHPPGELAPSIGDTAVVVCSDYRRSVESATRLVPDCKPRVSILFREVGRPWSGSWSVRLPLAVWDLGSRVLWWMNWITTDESIYTARRRARDATFKLVGLADEYADVLLVGHGMLNALIGRELWRLGWQGPRRATDEYWGMSTYQK